MFHFPQGTCCSTSPSAVGICAANLCCRNYSCSCLGRAVEPLVRAVVWARREEQLKVVSRAGVVGSLPVKGSTNQLRLIFRLHLKYSECNALVVPVAVACLLLSYRPFPPFTAASSAGLAWAGGQRRVEMPWTGDRRDRSPSAMACRQLLGRQQLARLRQSSSCAGIGTTCQRMLKFKRFLINSSITVSRGRLPTELCSGWLMRCLLLKKAIFYNGIQQIRLLCSVLKVKLFLILFSFQPSITQISGGPNLGLKIVSSSLANEVASFLWLCTLARERKNIFIYLVFQEKSVGLVWRT